MRSHAIGPALGTGVRSYAIGPVLWKPEQQVSRASVSCLLNANMLWAHEIPFQKSKSRMMGEMFSMTIFPLKRKGMRTWRWLSRKYAYSLKDLRLAPPGASRRSRDRGILGAHLQLARLKAVGDLVK